MAEYDLLPEPRCLWMCYEPTPICRPIDEYAILIPKNSGLLPCLYVPIAARDTAAIEKYVGRIAGQLPSSALDKALLVERTNRRNLIPD
jgi:hypothetical protein